MLGPPKSRRLDEPIAVSLDDLVPRAHFYRHLEAKLDLGFVREWAQECYADRGRPSIDPIVFFKLQLVMFFEGIRSERQLIETASLHLAHRWYLGYALDEDLPDHSSLTRIRERLGLPIFRRFFERVVELCRDAGLVWGRELLVDATKVRGNAAMDSLVPRLAEVVDGHLVPLFGGGTKAEEPGPGTDGEAPRLLHPTAASDPAAGQDGEPRWDLLEECRLDPDRPLSPGYRRLSAHRVSRTDPDATPMTMADKRTALGYQTHYLVDGGKARIILHALVTPADVMENQPLLDQLRRAIFRWKLRPERLIADTTYGTIENIRALEEQEGIRAFVPLPDWEHKTAFYGPAKFTYDAERDVYVCPQGTRLRPCRREQKAEKTEYRAEAVTCNACPVKAQCTPSNHGRRVHRSFHAEYLERVRSYHQTPAYAKAMRKRQVWVEPLFAEAKQWHGLERFRLRGLPKVNSAGLLVAAGQNLKRWLRATGWGRRQWPGGAALPVPAAR